jgi:hypothetical protein
MPTPDTSKFDLSTALPIAVSNGAMTKRPDFDLTSARPVADLGGGKTPFEAFQKDGSGDLADAISKPISYGHAEYIQNAAKDPWYHGIQEGWEALRRPVVEGVVGFATRPFGKNIDTSTGNIVDGQNPDQYKQFVMKEHPVMGNVGQLIGGFAPFIVAAPLLPETMLATIAGNAAIGMVSKAGDIGIRNATQSLLDQNPNKMDQMSKDANAVATEGALWGFFGAWGKTVAGMKIPAESVKLGATTFEAFMQKSYAAFQKAAVTGAGDMAASNVAGYNLEESFKTGAFLGALHFIASTPASAKTALGRGILNNMSRRLNEAYESGELKVAGAEPQGTAAGKAYDFTINVDKWDDAMTRTKVTDMFRAIYQLTKPRLDKMAAGDPVFNPETGTTTPWLESPWAGVVAHPAYEIKPEPPKGPVFYSRMVEVLNDKMPNSAAPDQVMGILKSAGISPDEVGLSGIEDHLKGQEKIKKEDLVKFLQDNQTQVGEKIYSNDAQVKNANELAARAEEARGRISEITNELGGRPYVSGRPLRWMYRDDSGSTLDHSPKDVPAKYTQELDELNDVISAHDEFVNNADDPIVGQMNTKYHGEATTLPGGENYREILQTLPNMKGQESFGIKQISKNEFVVEKHLSGDSQDTELGPVHSTKEQAQKYLDNYQRQSAAYRSSHWDEPNVLAHMRVDDRVSGSGDKVLMVQEVQSDWDREARQKGYADPSKETKLTLKRATEVEAKKASDDLDADVSSGMWIVKADDGSILNAHEDPELPEAEARDILITQVRDNLKEGVPYHPLVKKWQDLSLKRILRLAAEEGHEYAAFISGQQTADRYDLSKQVDSVKVKKDVFGLYDLQVKPKNAPVMSNKKVHEKDLADFVGKDLAKRIIEDLNTMPTDTQEYSGLDLKVGGEWAVNLYDEMIPAWLERYGKRFGAKPEYINVPLPGEPDNMQLAMRITPALRAFLLEKGNPLFGTPQVNKNGTMYEQQGQMDFNAPQEATVSEDAINQDAPYQWTGISDLKAVNERAAEIVKEAFKVYGKSNDITPEHEQMIRQYLAEAIAGLDTDLIYDDLSVFCDSINPVDRPDMKGKIMGAFIKKNLSLVIAKNSKFTGAHEVGHYLDNKWAREFGLADESLSTVDWDMLQAIGRGAAHKAWASEFRSFVDTLVGKADNLSEYTLRPDEVFARFVAMFVDWTRAQAGKVAFYEPYYSDKFTESDYLQFVRILQEKAALNKEHGIKATVDNQGKKIQYEVEPTPEERLTAIENKIKAVVDRMDGDYGKNFKPGMDKEAFLKPYLEHVNDLEEKRQAIIEEMGLNEPTPMTPEEIEAATKELNAEFNDQKRRMKKYLTGKFPTWLRKEGEYEGLLNLKWLWATEEQSNELRGAQSMRPDEWASEFGDEFGLDTTGGEDAVRDIISTYFKDEIWKAAENAVYNVIAKDKNKKIRILDKVVRDGAKSIAKIMKMREREVAKILKRVGDRLAERPTPSEYKKIIKERTGQIEKYGKHITYGELMRDRVKTAKAAFKAGREDVFNTIVQDLKWEKDNTADTKKQIADYAKAFLPQGIRAKAIPMIVNAKNQKDLIKAFVRINDMAEEYEKKALIAEVKDILKEIMDAQNIDIKEIEKAKKAVAGMDFKNHNEETLSRIEKMKAAIEKAKANGDPIEVTAKMAKELAILDKDSVKEMSMRNIQAIKAHLEVLRELGKKKLKTRESIRKLRKQIIEERILSAIKNIDKVNLPQRKAGEKWTTAQYFQQFILQRQKGLQRMDLALTQMDVFFDLLDGGNGTFDGPCFKHFKATTDLNYQAYMGIKDAHQRPLMDLAKKLELNGYNFERIGVFAAAQQEDGMEKLAGMGYSEEEVASYVLDEKEKEWYDAARSAFDALHSPLEKFMHEEFNQPLGQVKNYFSFMTDHDAMDDAEVAARFAEQSEYSRAKKTPNKDFTIARVGGSQKIQLNAYKIAMRHLDNVAYLMAMTHDNRILFEISNGPKFREAAGEMGTAFTIDWLDTIARKGGAEGQKRIDWLDVLRRNIGVATLGFKDTTILIQLSSILDGGAYIGNYAFKGLTDITNPEWAAFVMAMPEIQHREGDDPAFHEVDPDKVMPAFAWYAEFQKKGMLPIQKVDMMSAMAIAAGAYQKYMVEHGLAIDFSKPNPQAMEYAQRIVRRSQGSSFFKDAPQAGVRGKITGNRSVDKALLQFQNFMLAVRWNTIRNEIWRNGIKAGNYKDALGKSYWFLLSSLYGIGMMYGLSKLKDLLTGADTKFDAGKKLMAEAFNQVPLIGSLMGEVATGQQPGMPAPVIDTMVQTSKDIGYIASSKRPESKGKAAVRTAMDMARMGGVPGTAMTSNLVNRAMKKKKSGVQGVKIQGVKMPGVKIQGVKIK